MNWQPVIHGITILSLTLIVGLSGAWAKKNKNRERESRPIYSQKTIVPTVSPLKKVSEIKPLPSSKGKNLYRPPRRGAPGGRVGGGTRGPQADLPEVLALVPDHLGLTSMEQPSFAWYISRPTSHPLEFTIIDENGVTPLIEKPLPSPTVPGVHLIELSQFDLKLEEGKTYQWFVALIPDPQHRSKDIIAGGIIEMDSAPPDLQQNIEKGDAIHATTLYAQAGFWYDAMTTISHHIQSDPTNAHLREIRAALLDQVQLSRVSQEDRMGKAGL